MRHGEHPNDFGGLARRIADGTTKALFSALVIVGGLGFGRQVLRWWQCDDAPPAETDSLALMPAGLAEGTEPIEVCLGDLPLRLGRQTIVGDRPAALNALRTACQKALPSALPWSSRAGADEEKLLARLAELKPLRSSPPKDEVETANRIYEPAPGMPLIVGTRRLAIDRSQSTAAPDRVVLWGLATPAGEREWTLHLFQAGRRDAKDDPQKQIPLPVGCQPLLSLQRGGGGMRAFQCAATCDECRQFYNSWYKRQRPHEPIDWKPTGDGGWYAGARWHDSDTAAERTSSLMIQLLPGRFGGCTGMVFDSVAR